MLEMAFENRFEQYDVNIDRPQPLVPRRWRLPVAERMNAAGEALVPLAARSCRSAGADFGGAGHRKRRRRLSARLRQPAPRAADPRRACHGAAGTVDHAGERRLPGDPRVRALLNGMRQRLREAVDGALSGGHASAAVGARRRLPVSDDDVRRRPRVLGDGAGVSDPAGGIGPGRRRHPRGAPRRTSRFGAGGVAGHGRHHGEDLPDRRRHAPGVAFLRSGSQLSVPQGQRPAGADSGHRNGGDRRRRRLHCLPWTGWAGCKSGRRAPAPAPGQRATAAAGKAPP